MSLQHRFFCLGLLALAISGLGCEKGLNANWPIATPAEQFREEEQKRQQYITKGESEAIRWLLKNRISSGQTLDEVNQMLGQDGIREYNDGQIKNNGGTFRQSDEVFKWGPDADGNSYMLVFRERKLVNFNRDDYE